MERIFTISLRTASILLAVRAKKGIFITTSDFTKEATDYAAMIDSRIVLTNGVRLCNLMIDHGIGVTRATSYEMKRLDSDYFEEQYAFFAPPE